MLPVTTSPVATFTGSCPHVQSVTHTTDHTPLLLSCFRPLKPVTHEFPGGPRHVLGARSVGSLASYLCIFRLRTGVSLCHMCLLPFPVSCMISFSLSLLTSARGHVATCHLFSPSAALPPSRLPPFIRRSLGCVSLVSLSPAQPLHRQIQIQM